MKRYLLDSNALNLFAHDLRGVRGRALLTQQNGAVLGTALPVVAEILAGIELSASRDRNRPVIERALKTLRIWPFDLTAAREYAPLYAATRRKGDQIQVIDLMIAAVSRTLPDCTIVSNDSDFSRIPGIHVVDWADAP